jgi:hypothetical protein
LSFVPNIDSLFGWTLNDLKFLSHLSVFQLNAMLARNVAATIEIAKLNILKISGLNLQSKQR